MTNENQEWEKEFDDSFPMGEPREFDSFPYPIDHFTRKQLKKFIAQEKSLSYSQAVQDCLLKIPMLILNRARGQEPAYDACLDMRNDVIIEARESIKSLLK